MKPILNINEITFWKIIFLYQKNIKIQIEIFGDSSAFIVHLKRDEYDEKIIKTYSQSRKQAIKTAIIAYKQDLEINL